MKGLKKTLGRSYTYCFEQTLVTAPHEIKAIRTLPAHLTKSSKEKLGLLEHQIRTDKRFSVCSHTPIHQWWLTTNKTIFINSVQSLHVIFRICQDWWMIRADGKRESQVNPCYQHYLMIMIIIYIYIYIYIIRGGNPRCRIIQFECSMYRCIINLRLKICHHLKCRAKRSFYIKVERKNSLPLSHYEFISGHDDHHQILLEKNYWIN